MVEHGRGTLKSELGMDEWLEKSHMLGSSKHVNHFLTTSDIALNRQSIFAYIRQLPYMVLVFGWRPFSRYRLLSPEKHRLQTQHMYIDMRCIFYTCIGIQSIAWSLDVCVLNCLLCEALCLWDGITRLALHMLGTIIATTHFLCRDAMTWLCLSTWRYNLSSSRDGHAGLSSLLRG